MPTSPRQMKPILRKSPANSYFPWVDVGLDPYERNVRCPYKRKCAARDSMRRNRFLIILADMKNGGCEGEVDEQGQKVHDRRDDRGGHDCRVEAELLGQQRKRAADELCKEDRHGHGKAHDERDPRIDRFGPQEQMVDQHDLREAGHSQANTAEHSHADLFPDDLENVAELDLVQADAADDGDTGLLLGCMIWFVWLPKTNC